ncbi:MAG TPA: DUF4386 domain-containing protein [Prolixibacteraceae bacterium]|nr:DUF4386 domain-containing protein [Prolixibacteraceae bacterium]
MSTSPKISLSSAALIAGIGLLVMAVAAPFAELYVLPKLIVPYMTAETAANIQAHETLFTAAIYAYFITFICDLVVAWALYILLKPVNEYLSLLTALFRWVYTLIAIMALMNLITALQLITTPKYLTIIEKDQLYAQAMISIRAFKNHWYFGISLFAIHLFLLGYMVIKSTYIPKILGILLILSGTGYLLNSVKPYFFPSISVDFAMYTFFGELIFMLWLLIKGPRLQEIG